MSHPASPGTETSVKERYAAAAKVREAALCCPVDYNQEFLKVIPEEVIKKDYGCGDPSQFLNPGETVLDLGSGTGKICFIASQVVGPSGKVIGVDMTDDMLEVAQRNAPIIGERIGYSNVEFKKGRIQDLALDLEALDLALKEKPIDSSNAFLAAQELAESLRIKKPLIEDNSIDVVVSNCVLNLVESSAKKQLFQEIFRVIRPNGRAVISDIVSDEPVPQRLQADPELWSGCISGALTETAFLEAFEEAGFYGVELVKRDSEPWQTVEGIEFFSVTVQAYKPENTPALEKNQAAVYHGPFKRVLEDEGQWFERGQRHAISERTFKRLKKPPFNQFFELISPKKAVENPVAFKGQPGQVRPPHETKGRDFRLTTSASSCCDPGTECC